MVFSSIEFLVFFAVVSVLLWITGIPLLSGHIKTDKLINIRQGILLIASYIFCGWTDWRFSILLFAITLFTYISAKGIECGKHRKVFMILGVAVPVLILIFFKYFNFFISSFNDVAGTSIRILKIILPVGISFYIFQTLSYVIDVYRGQAKTADSFLKYAFYIGFFPKLISGPLVKNAEFMPQLNEDRNISLDNLKAGIQIFLFGLFKKIVLADNIAVFVDQVYGSITAYHSVTVILAVLSYSIQIYMDFSGYSDMAVGCARCLGYDLPRNFNMPYISKNVTEFWKRWHISLSSWLQQYIYITLGGNRKGNLRRYFNLLATMAIGGLWHGANWTYILWGVTHGIALCIHKVFMNFRKGKKAGRLKPLTDILSMAATFIFVSITWFALFRLENISDIGVVLKSMFIWHSGIVQIYSWSVFGIIIVTVATVIGVIRSKKVPEQNGKQISINGFYPIVDLNKFWSIVWVLLLICLIMSLGYTDSNPFIYFQF